MGVRKLEKCYRTFYNLLEEEKVFMDRTISFETICFWLKIPPGDLDAFLFHELGLSGENILKIYRDSVSLSFSRKYGIVL